MSNMSKEQAKLKRLKDKVKVYEKEVSEAQKAYNKDPSLEREMALCMANLSLADAKAQVWLQEHQQDAPGNQPGE